MRLFCAVSLMMMNLLLAAGSAHGEGDSVNINNWPEQWKTARSLFDAGKYEESLSAFLSEPKTDNAMFYYNVGTVYLRLGKLGPALAYLEKANRLAPMDLEIRHNLLLSRDGLGAVLGTQKLDPASNGVEKLADRVPVDEVRGTLGLLGIILFLLWIRTYLKTRALKVTLTRPGALFVLAAFLVSLSLYLTTRTASSRPPAIFMDRQVIRSGPGSRFVELGQAEAGTKVRLLGQSVVSTDASPQPGAPAEVWHQVRFSQEGIGWVQASSLLLL